MVKIGHTNVNRYVQNAVLNEWVLDRFVETDYARTRDDPYSRRGTMYSWHDEGFEEEEQWESGIEKTDYDPPRVSVETFKVK
nr:hypothetical protein [Tanacetum cinerariifolium]